MITTWLVHFTDWLGSTGLFTIIAGHFWIVPALQTVHILSVAAVLSAVLLINLRIVGVVERGQPVASVLDRFLTPLAVAVGILALTGVLLITGEPTRAIFRTIFWVKMALILIAFALTWSHRKAFASALDDAAVLGSGGVAATPARKAVALLALLLWLSVIVAGRWIAYVEAWPGAPA